MHFLHASLPALIEALPAALAEAAQGGGAQSGWLPVLAGVLLASLWQTALLVSSAACALWLLPGLSAASRSTIWAVVLGVGVASPLALLFPGTHMPSHGPVWHIKPWASGAFVTLWFAGAAFRCTQLILSADHLYALLRRAEPVDVTPEIAALLSASTRRVSVRVSPGVDRPSVAGFLRPYILLSPALLTTLTPEELHTILLHELEHLRRRDDWINLLQQLSLALFPLSPALVWLDRRLALERELACDDSVLRATGARKAYAACLARVAEGSLVHRSLALAIGMLGSWGRKPGSRPEGSRPELTRRVERILAPPSATLNRFGTRLVTGILYMGLFGGATLLTRSPQFVSFATASSPAAQLAANVAPDGGKIQPADRLPVRSGSGPGRAPQVLLLKATLPAARLSPYRPRLTRVSPSVRLDTVARPRVLPRSAPRGVRTAWQGFGAPGAEELPSPTHVLQTAPVLIRIVPVTLEDTQAWYTAVRVPEGWILIQI